MTEKDPSAIVIPFGKHKGKTVAELLVADPQYADWVTAQAWVAERFAELHAAILSRGAGADDSPEHNAIQARFLDRAFCLAMLQVTSARRIVAERDACLQMERASLTNEIERITEHLGRLGSSIERARARPQPLEGWYAEEFARDLAKQQKLQSELPPLEKRHREWPFTEWPLKIHTTFEHKGIDVALHALFDKGYPLERGIAYLTVEIKPTLGDDYPTVMRQMMRLEAKYLVVGIWTGRGVTEPQMRAMFQASGIRVVFVQEIEEQMRLASEPRP
jgi:hypothetical protein